MRARAERAGYPGRAFAQWARLTLLNKNTQVQRPSKRVALLSVAEAAERCGVSRQQFYVWIKDGKVPTQDLPEGIRVYERDLKTLAKQG